MSRSRTVPARRAPRRAARAALPALLAALALVAGPACTDPGAAADLPAGDVPDATDLPPDVPPPAGDHTVPSFATTAAFLAYAGPDRSPAQVKFVLRDFQSAAPAVHFEEPAFYAMHDEWSWYSLLNGIPIPGYDFAPLQGLAFATVADILDWADGLPALPLDLAWVEEGRLYSPRFYERAFDRVSKDGTRTPRFFGCGSVLHFDPDPRRPLPGETWAFELEYGDLPAPADLQRFFDTLSAALPPGAGDSLLWLARSSAQQALAAQIDAAGGPLAGRWTTWESLQVPGDAQVYNPGIAAGRVRILPPGEMPVGDLSLSVAVLREIPDDLPPVAAIVTAVPQTPLSHIGLLARARGTPNLYVAGVADDPRFVTWDAYGRSIVVQATAEGHRFREMTAAEWAQYQALLTPRQADLPPVDVPSLPDTFDPLAEPMDRMAEFVPAIGGKTAGFLALHAYPELDLPDRALGLTVRGYAEFVATLDPPLADVLAVPDAADPGVLLALTEGPEAYLAARGNSGAAQAFLARLQQDHAGDALGRCLQAGGIRQMIRTAPMDPAWLLRVTAALSERFAFLAPAQGLRFRSSSSAEDVEGFNGAGLYESHTGYLHPELQKPRNRSKTVEDALRQVWASYWLYSAVQERAQAGIDHLDAAMGVLVHPVFDDDREAMNGVLTLELVRRPAGDVVTLVANAQAGALSVTNPPPGSGALPEVDVVRRTGDGAPVIERQRASTEVAPGTLLLSDAELLAFLDVLARMAGDWLDLRNAPLPAPQRRTTLTLDLEIKRMSPGWPSRADGVANPERLVVKQARTLEQPVRAPDPFGSLPVPRDVLALTARIEQRSCRAGELRLDAVEFFTDPTRPWPFDHAREPFTAYAAFQIDAALPGFPFVPGKPFSLTHLQASFDHPGLAQGGPWALEVLPAAPATAGFSQLSLKASGAWSLQGPDGARLEGTDLSCTRTVLMTSPEAYLESLMEAP